MIINPYAFGVAYDPDAQAFFTASGLTGATNLTAINQLVVDLKTYGIWTKMKAIYPIIGGTAALHKWNLKDPRDLDAAFRLVFSGGWTHSANGATPNGLNAFANTFFNASVNSIGINNIHISAYSRTNIGSSGALIGANFASSVKDLHIFPRFTDNLSYFRVNSTNDVGVNTGGNSTGFFIANRLTSTQTVNFRNSTKYTLLTPSFIISDINITLAATGGLSNYSSMETAFASIGDGLTDAEALAFYNAVQTFNTTLGRNV